SDPIAKLLTVWLWNCRPAGDNFGRLDELFRLLVVPSSGEGDSDPGRVARRHRRGGLLSPLRWHARPGGARPSADRHPPALRLSPTSPARSSGRPPAASSASHTRA